MPSIAILLHCQSLVYSGGNSSLVLGRDHRLFFLNNIYHEGCISKVLQCGDMTLMINLVSELAVEAFCNSASVCAPSHEPASIIGITDYDPQSMLRVARMTEVSKFPALTSRRHWWLIIW